MFHGRVNSASVESLCGFFSERKGVLTLHPSVAPSVTETITALFRARGFPVHLYCTKGAFVGRSDCHKHLGRGARLNTRLVNISSVRTSTRVLTVIISKLGGAKLGRFRMDVKRISFVRDLFRTAGLRSRRGRRVHALVTGEGFFNIRRVLSRCRVTSRIGRTFRRLPRLANKPRVLTSTKHVTPNRTTELTMRHLHRVCSLLGVCKMRSRMAFSLDVDKDCKCCAKVVFHTCACNAKSTIMHKKHCSRLLRGFKGGAPSVKFTVVLSRLVDTLSHRGVGMRAKRHGLLICASTARR